MEYTTFKKTNKDDYLNLQDFKSVNEFDIPTNRKKSRSPSKSHPLIEGEVILKRRSTWVKRYAQIEHHLFSYKKHPFR
jgi:hypothetical protein